MEVIWLKLTKQPEATSKEKVVMEKDMAIQAKAKMLRLMDTLSLAMDRSQRMLSTAQSLVTNANLNQRMESISRPYSLSSIWLNRPLTKLLARPTNWF